MIVVNTSCCGLKPWLSCGVGLTRLATLLRQKPLLIDWCNLIQKIHKGIVHDALAGTAGYAVQLVCT